MAPRAVQQQIHPVRQAKGGQQAQLPLHPFADMLPLDQACRKCAQCSVSREQALCRSVPDAGELLQSSCRSAAQTINVAIGAEEYISFPPSEAWAHPLH